MDEVRSKAIPLRRGRGASATPATMTARATGALESGVRLVLAPPRFAWLATLGSTALAMRAVASAWSRVIAEGEEAERWLRGPREQPDVAR